MGWLRHLPALHSAVTGALGETVELQSSDAVSTVSVQGVYKRPSVVTDEVGGVDYRGADHEVTIKETDVPAWLERGSLVRTLDRFPVVQLAVVEPVPDGQGLVTLWCRRAV